MNSAILFALGTTFTWGLWLVLADLASDAVDPVAAAAITYVVAAEIGVLVLGDPLSPTRAGIGLAVVSIVLISQ
jgi:uncharacterized membrane protein